MKLFVILHTPNNINAFDVKIVMRNLLTIQIAFSKKKSELHSELHTYESGFSMVTKKHPLNERANTYKFISHYAFIHITYARSLTDAASLFLLLLLATDTKTKYPSGIIVVTSCTSMQFVL